MKDRVKEFVPSLEDAEELRQGYRVFELGPSSFFDKRYRLEFLLTLPGTLRIRDENDKVVKELKTYQNYIFRFTKAYNFEKNLIQIGVGKEICENGIESFNPMVPISVPLLKKMIEFMEMARENAEPPEPPNPRDVYLSLRAVFEKYIEVEPEVISLLSIYVISTYFFRLFNTFPYLYIFGPRQSGKTKLLALMTKLCYNALSTVNLSASALFRVVNDFGSTLVIDESEYLQDMERKSDIQTLLLAGYKKDTANVMRVEGEEKKHVKIFNVFGPKVMASINYPHDVLLDRCIIINMVRGTSQKINLEPAESFQEVRDGLYLLLFTKFDEIYNIRDKNDFDNPLLTARERELWRPLLVVASWLEQYLGDEERERLRNDLDKVIGDNCAKKAEMRTDSELNMLLYKLADLVQEDGYYSVATIRSAILDEYRADETELKQAKKVWTPERIGRMLTGLKFARRRRSDGTYYYIAAERVRKLCESYGISVEEAGEGQGNGLESFGVRVG